MKTRILTVVLLLAIAFSVMPFVSSAETSGAQAIADDEYPELLKGKLTKEQFEVILAYAPASMSKGEVSPEDLENLLQNIAMDATFGDLRYIGDFNALIGVDEVSHEPDLNEYGGYSYFNYSQLSNFLSVLTDGALTQGMVATGVPYETIVSDDMVGILIPDGDGGWYNTASITDSVLNEDNEIVVTYEVVSRSAQTDEVKLDETRVAFLRQDPAGFYRIYQIGDQSTGTAGSESQNTAAAESLLPEEIDGMEFGFSSGAGSWGNSLILYQDGSFEGEYSNWDAVGDVNGVEVNGVYYRCSYTGTFKDIETIDDHTWSLTLDQVNDDLPLGETWVQEDGNTCVVVEPYGMEAGKQFYLYDPDTPLDGLNEEFLSWWPGRYYPDMNYTTLSCYGLYNAEQGYGFFSQIWS